LLSHLNKTRRNTLDRLKRSSGEAGLMGNREIKRRLSTLVALIYLVTAFNENRVALALDFQKPISQYLHDVWTTEQGLPQNSITSIVQTRDGYLWLGTFGGLARFDGVRFTVFTVGNTEGLTNNRIKFL
jgi:ligand-binding sensor domain-containing protein